MAVIALAPVWVDPVTLHSLFGGAAPSTTPVPIETDPFRPATNAPILRGTTVATDDFGREVPSGLGTAKQGGSYTQVGTGTIYVTGGSGTVSLANRSAGAAVLSDPSLSTVDELVTVALSSGAPSAEAGLSARVSGDSFYAALVTYLGGVASVSVSSVVDGVWAIDAGPIPLPEIDISQPIRLRFDSFGFDPTTIRVRAWNVGAPEPGQWAIDIVDWAGHMQKAGGIGVAWAISDDRRGVINVDDLVAQGE